MSWKPKIQAAIVDLSAALSDTAESAPEHLDDAARNIEAALDELEGDDEVAELAV